MSESKRPFQGLKEMLTSSPEKSSTANVSQQRRKFLFIFSTGMLALAYNACSQGFTSNLEDLQSNPSTAGSSSGSETTPSTGSGPVWQEIPTLSFTQGVAGRISVGSYVSDPDGFALTITKNVVALPPGVTFDAATKSFVYDGVGAVSATQGHVLTATES